MVSGDLILQQPVLPRVRLIHWSSENRDRVPACFDGAFVGGGVDASRQAAYHRDFVLCQNPGESARSPERMLVGTAGPNYRHPRAMEQERLSPDHEKPLRGVLPFVGAERSQELLWPDFLDRDV